MRPHTAFEIRVACRRLASSAQPPRATASSPHRFSTRPTPQPTRSISFLDTPGALREGLRYFTAFRPLPNPRRDEGNTFGF
jgi:hypothetical protein